MAIGAADMAKLESFRSTNYQAFEQAIREASKGNDLGIQTLVNEAGVSEEVAKDAAALFLEGGIDAVFKAGGAQYAKITGRSDQEGSSFGSSFFAGLEVRQPLGALKNLFAEVPPGMPKLSQAQLEALGERVQQLQGDEPAIEGAVAEAVLEKGDAEFKELHQKVTRTRKILGSMQTVGDLIPKFQRNLDEGGTVYGQLQGFVTTLNGVLADHNEAYPALKILSLTPLPDIEAAANGVVVLGDHSVVTYSSDESGAVLSEVRTAPKYGSTGRSKVEEMRKALEKTEQELETRRQSLEGGLKPMEARYRDTLQFVEEQALEAVLQPG